MIVYDHINMEGDNNAWCVLVMLNDKYICGALTMMESLRIAGTKYPIYCMVAGDVSNDGVDLLRRNFDVVVQVPLITHDCVPMKSAKQREIYESWIHHSFTKCNVLNPEYFPGIDKICFVDADMTFTENCDHLFDLQAPAMTFSSPWAYPYVSNDGKRFKGGPNPYYDKRIGELKHGQEVPKYKIRKGFSGGILGIACMLIVRPNTRDYDNMKRLLNRNKKYGVTNCMSGFDEQLFAETFLANDEPIYHIHQRFNWYVGKVHWLAENDKPKVVQYYNGKPWYVNNRDDIEKNEWDDVRDWWKIANRVLEREPSAEKWFFQGIHNNRATG